MLAVSPSSNEIGSGLETHRAARRALRRGGMAAESGTLTHANKNLAVHTNNTPFEQLEPIWLKRCQNVVFFIEMRTVCENGGWRTRDVRVIRLLELFFLQKRPAAFGPVCWRESLNSQLGTSTVCVATVRHGTDVLATGLAIVASKSASGRTCRGT